MTTKRSRLETNDTTDRAPRAPDSGVRLVCEREVVDPSVAGFEAHMHLVQRVVAGLLRKLPTQRRDELVEAGALGLLDAMRKNYAEPGSPGFESYARIRIRGAITEHLAKLASAPSAVAGERDLRQAA